MARSDQELARTAMAWNEAPGRLGTGTTWWQAGPELGRHFNRMVSNDPKVDWVQYTSNQYFQGRLPVESCLSLGCGNGYLERRLARMGFFVECDAYDIADQRVCEAQELAHAEGFDNIQYRVADVNRIDLQANRYDAVWINSAMHHFSALEHVCEQIRLSLRPGGYLVLNEYVGPNRFQFPERQKQIANLVLGLLPGRYRRLVPDTVERQSLRYTATLNPTSFASRVVDKLRDGDLPSTVWRKLRAERALISGQVMLQDEVGFPTVRSVVSVDPSEAVRSQEIVDVVREYFSLRNVAHMVATSFSSCSVASQGIFLMRIPTQLHSFV